MRRIDILAPLPGLFRGFLEEGVIGRAAKDGVIEIHLHDLREWGEGTRRTIDDRPYGGGPGMLLMAEPILRAVREIRRPGQEFILLSAAGEILTQAAAAGLAAGPDLLLLAGRYEGIDARVEEILAPRILSIGKYVLSGGEVAAMVVVEAVARLVPGVLGDPRSPLEESYAGCDLVEAPSYTHPEVVEGRAVPEVLRSGHHARIEAWRAAERERRTREFRMASEKGLRDAPGMGQNEAPGGKTK